MALNIKSQEAHKLAHELAQLTGQSMTAVVVEALQRRWEEIKYQQQKKKRVQALMAIGQRCANHIQQPIASIDHGDMLYNSDGMPL